MVRDGVANMVIRLQEPKDMHNLASRVPIDRWGTRV